MQIRNSFSVQEYKAWKQDGLTNLQLSAREGLIDAILENITINPNVDQVENNSSTEPPLYLAMENGHPLAANILLACGADIEKSKKLAELHDNYILSTELYHLQLKNSTVAGIQCWALARKNIVSSSMASANDNMCQGLLEFASYQNDLPSVKIILNHVTHYRLHSQIRTAAYWAAVNDNQEIFQLVCRTDEDAVYTLWQLKQDKQAGFQKYYDWLAKNKPSAIEKFEHQLYEIVTKEIDTLDSKYFLAYEAACTGNESTLKLVSYRAEKFLAILKYSYEQNNFVAIFQCMKIWDSAPDVFRQFVLQHIAMDLYLVENPDPLELTELLRFWLIANNLHPYQFLLANQNTVIVHPFTQAEWSQKGLLQHAVRRQLEAPTPDDAALFLKIPKRDIDVFLSLIIHLQRRYPEESLTPLLNSDESNLQKRISSFALSKPMQILLDDCFKKLGLAIRCGIQFNKADFNKLPSVLWIKTINEMLNGEESLPLVSRNFYLYSNGINPANRDMLRQQIKSVDKEIQQNDEELEKIRELGLLLEMIENELNSMPFCKGRSWPKFYIFLFASTLILGAFTIYETIDSSLIANQIVENMKLIFPTTNSTLNCNDYAYGVHIKHRDAFCRHKIPTPCKDSCLQYSEEYTMTVLWGLFSAIASSISLTALGFFCHDTFKPENRKKYLEEKNPLSNFSSGFYKKITETFQRYGKTAHDGDSIRTIRNEINSMMQADITPIELAQQQKITIRSIYKSRLTVFEREPEQKKFVSDSKYDVRLDVLSENTLESLSTPLLDEQDSNTSSARSTRCPSLCVIM